MELEKAFRELRDTWFTNHLKKHAQERVWEDEEDEQYREEDNKRIKIKYDEQTEAIIRGENKPLAPKCPFDMEKHK